MSSLTNVATCPICGVKFTKGRKWQEYCTRSCKDKGYHLNRAKQIKEEMKSAPNRDR